jgi:magnesium-transporting ATPase (P-type)
MYINMSYDIILIGTISIIIYLFSYALYSINKISKKLHQRIWNIIILISFLLTFGMAYLQTTLTEFGLNIPIVPDLIYWHGEIGILFFFVLLFHLQINWGSLRKLVYSIKE